MAYPKYRHEKIWNLVKDIFGIPDEDPRKVDLQKAMDAMEGEGEAGLGSAPATKDLTSGIAGANKNLGTPDTFIAQGSSLSPEEQKVVKTPETFSGQKTEFWTGKESDMSGKENKLVNIFMGQNGTVITDEELANFTLKERENMYFSATGVDTLPRDLDLELSRLRYKAQSLFEQNARR